MEELFSEKAYSEIRSIHSDLADTVRREGFTDADENVEVKEKLIVNSKMSVSTT